MNVFALWYVYYDSIFVEPQLKPKKIVLQGFLHEIQQPISWPYGIKEPSIAQCFKILQNFILNPDNWHKQNCSENELLQIQSKINKIYIFLLIEKQYAIQFWKTSKRRLQSSICHFFIFLQNLIKAIIPEDNMTIQDCWRKQILCTSPSNIQKMFHSVMQHYEKLFIFMNRPEFNSQKILISQFFEYYNWFIENACSIKKKEIGKVPKLLLYINLSNPIEISRRKIIQQETIRVKIRKKSNTVGSKPQRKRKSEDILRFNYQDLYKEFNGYIYRSRRFNKSCDAKICSVEEKKDLVQNYKIPYLFRFKPQMFKQNSISRNNRKKQTISTEDYIPSLASLLPNNLRNQQVYRSNVARTQSLESQNPSNKILRSNTAEIRQIPLYLAPLKKSLQSTKGQKARRKFQKKINIIISSKDQQTERNDLKQQTRSIDLMKKLEIPQKSKEKQTKNKISLSAGSRNIQNSQQQKMKEIQKSLKMVLKKF